MSDQSGLKSFMRGQGFFRHRKFSGVVFLAFFAVCFGFVLTGESGGDRKDRAYLSNSDDINRTDSNVADIDIHDLPLKFYPLLSKFRFVKQISLDCRQGDLATDEQLEALGKLSFTNLEYIILTNCRLVTDRGINSLTNLTSLKGVGLEGTAITDTSLDTISSHMRLSSVNVANCKGIGFPGLQKLAGSTPLKEISFSADNLTQEQILNLFELFKGVNWCEIVDRHEKLDVEKLKKKAAEKSFSLVIKPTGALQDLYGIEK